MHFFLENQDLSDLFFCLLTKMDRKSKTNKVELLTKGSEKYNMKVDLLLSKHKRCRVDEKE